MDGQWDLVISSLQDIHNANAVVSYDKDLDANKNGITSLTPDQLQLQLERVQKHLENVKGAQRLVDAVEANVGIVLEHSLLKEKEKERAHMSAKAPAKAPPPSSPVHPTPAGDSGAGANAIANTDVDTVIAPEVIGPDASGVASPPPSAHAAKPLGRSGWVSQYNPSGPIGVGSEVAFKPRKGGEAEWFQCEVVKVSADGLRFEVRDPEPDELGNPGKTFKCSWKDIIFITPDSTPKSQIPNYPPGTKVLARYPETTTFYPAVVIGTKRDGSCRLRFDGEEEVDKETEVLRRLVLPCPTISSTMAKK